MVPVYLACRDLMTASRLRADGVEVRSFSRDDRLIEALAREAGPVTVFVDLTAFPALPERIREGAGDHPRHRIIAFAPHVQEAVLEAARPFSDRVLPRGSVVKRFARLALGDTAD